VDPGLFKVVFQSPQKEKPMKILFFIFKEKIKKGKRRVTLMG